MKPIYDISVRISRMGNRDEASEAEQERAARARIEREGAQVGIVAVEKNVSGGKAATSRQIERLVRRIESGESAGIAIYDFSRLTREDAFVAMMLVGRIVGAGGRVLGAVDNYDSSAPGAAILTAAYAEQAHSYLRTCRERSSAGVRRAVDQGKHIGKAPFGYKQRDDGTLRIDPKTKPLVVEAFERKIQGQTTTEISRWLKAKGHSLSQPGVRFMIGNRTYLGETRHGQYANAAAHEPIIDVDTFRRSQFAKPTSIRKSTGVVSENVVVQGMVECETCGDRLSTNVRYRKTGQAVFAMRCDNIHCSTRAGIQVADLEAEVEDQMLAKLSLALRTIWPEKKQSQADDARKRLATAQQATDAFIENTDALVLIGKDKWNQQLVKLIARVDSAAAALAEASEADDRDEWWDKPIRFKELWLSSGVEQRRSMLLRVVERIDVKPVRGRRGIPACERVEIVWREPKRQAVKIGLAKTA